MVKVVVVHQYNIMYELYSNFCIWLIVVLVVVVQASLSLSSLLNINQKDNAELHDHGYNIRGS